MQITYTVGIHILTVLSLLPLATSPVTGQYATASTAALCPLNRYARNCGLKFQTITLPSFEPEMSCNTRRLEGGRERERQTYRHEHTDKQKCRYSDRLLQHMIAETVMHFA